MHGILVKNYYIFSKMNNSIPMQESSESDYRKNAYDSKSSFIQQMKELIYVIDFQRHYSREFG
ncbi:hypothetical protein GUT189_05970 [Streptococcus ruminantium]|nr:hypothetical protein GUT189_05970 [Streptococcus ruminantium]